MTLHLYNFFHLNLAYSAIEEEDRAKVVERCYWPLLRLARERNLPFGIELSGYTLECIAELDPEWVMELRSLIHEGPCELIGCGYAQVIGPLVPSKVTAANLRIGHEVYERLLGLRPEIALLNEQAFSGGMVPLYRDADYRAIIMEWNNPAHGHADWDPEWRYLPQRAQGVGDSEIQLIWNKSIAFQKFQRYVHGELELDEILDYVRSHCVEHQRALPLYGNDVEVFDFRPGRYMTEAPLHGDGEWARVERLYASLQAEPGITFIRPSEVLTLADQSGADELLRLESSAQPIPVKKQSKYNVVRWAVTGRDDLDINTRCWRIFSRLNDSVDAQESDWRELCYLWSSDFRTHITKGRWSAYLERFKGFESKWSWSGKNSDWAQLKAQPAQGDSNPSHLSSGISGVSVLRNGRMLEIEGKRLNVRLNCLRGLALDMLMDREVCEVPLCGTLHHGYFDDIRYGADYYSGHLVLESPGRPKVTDLNEVEPVISEEAGGMVRIGARVQTAIGPVDKQWLIDDATGVVRLRYRLDWSEPFLGSLRLGHLTLMPEAFERLAMEYRTHNGGTVEERYALDDQEINHGSPVSFLVSASQALGVTEGLVCMGDGKKQLRARFDKNQAALIGLMSHHKVKDSSFTRLAFTAREMDDSSHPACIGPLDIELEILAECLTGQGG